MKTTIDDLIQKMFDTLVGCLRRSISKDINQIERYLTRGEDMLGSVPQTIEEVREANLQYGTLTEEKSKVRYVFDYFKALVIFC